MQKKITTVVLVLILSLAAAAGTARTQTAPPILVQTGWLAAHLNDKNLVILHVGANRTAYDAQHIPGARFLSLSEIAVMRNGIPNELPPLQDLKAAFERLGVGDNSRVVLYGDMAGMHAARAYFTLDYLGHRNTSLLDGGLEQWRAEQRPVNSAPVTATRATLTVKPRPELLVSLPAMKTIVSQKTHPLIDARPPRDYAGNGHLPGAKNVFWGDNIVSQQRPALRPVSEIRARYQAAGLRPGSAVVVYCQTGMQAAHGYVTLKLAGYKPALYDGSMFEWTASGAAVEH